VSGPATRPLAGPPRSYRFPVTESTRLDNGLTVVAAPLRRLPVATVLLLTPAGAEAETSPDAGVASLTARGLMEGTSQHDATTLSTAFEHSGGEVFSEAEWTHAACGTTVHTDKLGDTIALLGEMACRPGFPRDGMDRLREERLAELLHQRTEPRTLADELLLASCFVPGDRRAKPLAGDTGTVERCRVERTRAFYAERYVASESTLIVAGDVELVGVIPLATAAFGGWATGASSTAGHQPQMATSIMPARRVRLVHRPGASQSEIRVGHRSVPRRHPDFHAIMVMNAILGGLFNSRINLNLRERHAYTYGAFSAFDWRRDASVFAVSTAVQSEVTGPALREILGELRRIREHGVSEEELALARDYLIGVFPLRFETTAAIANALATRIAFGLDPAYFDTYRERVAEVTAPTVLRVAQEHLNVEQLQTVVVGDEALVESALTGLEAGSVEYVDPAT
jgi:zinc protease